MTPTVTIKKVSSGYEYEIVCMAGQDDYAWKISQIMPTKIEAEHEAERTLRERGYECNTK